MRTKEDGKESEDVQKQGGEGDQERVTGEIKEILNILKKYHHIKRDP